MPESSSGSGFTYRAFISYSHADKVWADWLHKALETYRVPSRLVGTTTAAGVIPRRLHPVFRNGVRLIYESGATLGRSAKNEPALFFQQSLFHCGNSAANPEGMCRPG